MTERSFRVLVVIEDDPDFRRLIRLTLTREPGLDVEGEAASAEEALPLAEAMQPDLVVLDHFIDGTVMGIELAPLLKKVSPDTKVLLFTTMTSRSRCRASWPSTVTCASTTSPSCCPA